MILSIPARTLNPNQLVNCSRSFLPIFAPYRPSKLQPLNYKEDEKTIWSILSPSWMSPSQQILFSLHRHHGLCAQCGNTMGHLKSKRSWSLYKPDWSHRKTCPLLPLPPFTQGLGHWCCCLLLIGKGMLKHTFNDCSCQKSWHLWHSPVQIKLEKSGSFFCCKKCYKLCCLL